MLLTRLVQHAAHRPGLPPPYYRPRPIRWVILLDSNGDPMVPELQDRADPEDPRASDLDVPYVYRSGSRPPAVLLVDTLEYVLGAPGKRGKEEADRRHADYLDLLDQWHQATGDPAAQAIRQFFDRWAAVATSETTTEDPSDTGIGQRLPIPPGTAPSDLVAIHIAGEWAHDRPSAREFWQQVVAARKRGRAGQGLCLVCGEVGDLLETIPESVKAGAIPVLNGRARDAQLVSINKTAQGRGGTIQLTNTPICERCGSQMMAAINALLTDQPHRRRCGDSVLVWWLQAPADVDADPLATLDQPPNPADVDAFLEQLYKPPSRSSLAAPDSAAFVAATLSTNQSRVVVRDWIDIPLPVVFRAVAGWFDQHRIASPARDGRHVFALWRLALATGRWRDGRFDPRTVPKGLERELLVAALRGTRLPPRLLPHLLHRIRADAHLDAPRAALLRLLLAPRPLRQENTGRKESTSDQEDHVMPELDPDRRDPAYQCGRAFAVLEALQYRALGKEVNTTVTDRLFRRATTSPRIALVPARRAASAHLRKLRVSKRPKDQAAGAALQRRLDDIFDRIADDIPASLDLRGQSQFLLGYHHQRAADAAAARAAKLDLGVDAEAAEEAATEGGNGELAETAEPQVSAATATSN